MQKKVVWVEGICLAQQHLQQWDRQIREENHFREYIFHPHPWGIVALSIQEEMLAKGEFKINHCEGIFPNGQVFKFHSDQDEILSCLLPQKTGLVEIFLAIPKNSHVRGITGYLESPIESAWQATYEKLRDEYDGQRCQEILMAELKLHLLTEKISIDTYYVIKIAEVNAEPGGKYFLKCEYIPPLLALKGSNYIMRELENIKVLMEHQISLWSQAKRSALVTGFWNNVDRSQQILQIYSRVSPILDYYMIHHQSHPEGLYRLLIGFLSELSICFDIPMDKKLIVYNHQQLTNTFVSLFFLLKNAIRDIVPINFKTITVKKVQPQYYQVEQLEKEIFAEENAFILSVKPHNPESDWVQKFLMNCKIASLNQIHSLVRSAMSGIPLQPLRQLPRDLMVIPGCEYFSLETSGLYWNAVKEQNNLGFYVPESFAHCEMELFIMNSNFRHAGKPE